MLRSLLPVRRGRAMRIETQYSSPSHSDRGAHSVRLLVLHATAGSFHSSLSWLCNPSTRVSAHYLISKSGRVVRLVSEDRAAWHAGRAVWEGERAVNEISIGVELENMNTGRDPYPPAQIEALTALVLDIKTRYPRIQLTRHMDVAVPAGRKTDPAGFDWGKWRAELDMSLPSDPFDDWGPIGKPQGEARGYAVPRAWLVNKKLGPCIWPETYSGSGEYSITEFANGVIYYLKRRNVALVELF